MALGALVTTGIARADYNGVGWIVPDAVAQAATLTNANAQSGNANKVTFTVSSLNFNSYGTSGCQATSPGPCSNPALDFTIGSFINSLGAQTGAATYSGTATSGTVLNAGGGGMLFEFTGTASFTANQAFSLAHDDGVQLYIGCTGAACGAGNLVLNQPGPTSPTITNFNYSGAQGVGNQQFTFVYGECCSAPAVFQTTLVPPTTVPEPGSVMLFGSVILGLATAMRRRMA